MELESTKSLFDKYVRQLQDAITGALQEVDPGLCIHQDNWERRDFKGSPGGGGITRAFSGEVIESAGVNTSEIFGEVDPAFAQKLQGGEGSRVWAAGISLIIHPRNPHIPTVHANFRMIHQFGPSSSHHWFGGGADLTPFVPRPQEFKDFHLHWQKALQGYPGQYPRMKKNCDQYFVNRHRNNEMRGVGGIFYDGFNSGDLGQDLAMTQALGDAFIGSYFPLVKKHKDRAFSEEQEDFQLHRRGRYVEFNLLHDRGTLFGLKTNGRTDSILISLPKRCCFSYCWQPSEGSEGEEMMQYYYPRDWVNEEI